MHTNVESVVAKHVSNFIQRNKGNLIYLRHMSEYMGGVDWPDYLQLYMRFGWYRCGSTPRMTLCISTVDVAPKMQGQGVFKEALQACLRAAYKHNVEFIAIENVVNPRFEQYFAREGWHNTEMNPLTYYKEVICLLS